MYLPMFQTKYMHKSQQVQDKVLAYESEDEEMLAKSTEKASPSSSVSTAGADFYLWGLPRLGAMPASASHILATMAQSHDQNGITSPPRNAASMLSSETKAAAATKSSSSSSNSPANSITRSSIACVRRGSGSGRLLPLHQAQQLMIDPDQEQQLRQEAKRISHRLIAMKSRERAGPEEIEVYKGMRIYEEEAQPRSGSSMVAGVIDQLPTQRLMRFTGYFQVRGTLAEVMTVLNRSDHPQRYIDCQRILDPDFIKSEILWSSTQPDRRGSDDSSNTTDMNMTQFNTPNSRDHEMNIHWFVLPASNLLNRDRDFLVMEKHDEFVNKSWHHGYTFVQQSVNIPMPAHIANLSCKYTRGIVIESGLVVVEANEPGRLDVMCTIELDAQGSASESMQRQIALARLKRWTELEDLLWKVRVMTQFSQRRPRQWSVTSSSTSLLSPPMQTKRMRRETNPSNAFTMSMRTKTKTSPSKRSQFCQICGRRVGRFHRSAHSCQLCDQSVCSDCSRNYPVFASFAAASTSSHTNTSASEIIKLRVCSACALSAYDKPKDAGTTIHHHHHASSPITEEIPTRERHRTYSDAKFANVGDFFVTPVRDKPYAIVTETNAQPNTLHNGNITSESVDLNTIGDFLLKPIEPTQPNVNTDNIDTIKPYNESSTEAISKRRQRSNSSRPSVAISLQADQSSSVSLPSLIDFDLPPSLMNYRSHCN